MNCREYAERFAGHHLDGEWFVPADPILGFIKAFGKAAA